MDIDKMNAFVNQVKSLEPARLTSRKLWLIVAVVGAMIYLFQTTLALIIWPVTILTGLYLIINYLESRENTKAKLEIKKALIESMSKDGISPEEAEIINKTV